MSLRSANFAPLPVLTQDSQGPQTVASGSSPQSRPDPVHNPGGTQHGVAIYYRAFGSGSATGKINGNTISKYQKGGIVANGAAGNVDITSNTVVGEGAIPYIAQNGIQ